MTATRGTVPDPTGGGHRGSGVPSSRGRSGASRAWSTTSSLRGGAVVRWSIGLTQANHMRQNPAGTMNAGFDALGQLDTGTGSMGWDPNC